MAEAHARNQFALVIAVGQLQLEWATGVALQGRKALAMVFPKGACIGTHDMKATWSVQEI